MQMNNPVIFILAVILISLGVFLLCAALFPIKEIVHRLPKGSLRNRWFLLLSLTIVFIFSYIGYGIIFRNFFNDLTDVIVPSVFFLGACFVFLISLLSLQTAIDIRKVYRLEEESITDSLTGAFNRRYLERRLGEEFSHSRQFGSPLSILLLDVDHFKEINDTAGHHAGDQVIEKLAKFILNLIRGSDVLVRFGGDEFVIIALNTPAETAGHFAKKIVKHISSQSFEVSGDLNSTLEIKLTVSIGVASLSDDIGEINQLISNADKALYCAKRDGRNCVRVYPNNS
jgi:diguanylate cyclase (GGDEF)-like protein